jgi:hypothetical protein
MQEQESDPAPDNLLLLLFFNPLLVTGGCVVYPALPAPVWFRSLE